MTDRRNDSSGKIGYQPSKGDSHPTKDGYAPPPSSERAPAPPPKNP